jgi:hypothetical protein
MWIRTADYVLAAAGFIGHLALLIVLIRRRLLSRLPTFALLIAFYLLRSALLLVPRFAVGWPRSYWLLIYLDPGLQLLVILALGLVAWRCSDHLSFGGARVALAIPLFAFIAALVAWYIGPSSHYSPQNLSIKLSLFISALWLQVAAGLFILLRRTDLQTRRLSLGIALGFAAYSAANIATEIVHMHFALLRLPALYTGLSYFRVLVYLSCLAGWSILFLRDRRSQVTPSVHTIHG